MAEIDYREFYVYLDFNEKLDQDFFNKPDLFFKIVNLHKNKPLVQIGSYLFEGIYEDCIGTKVFLKDVDDGQQHDVFRKKTPIQLEYLTKTLKCISLKYLKIPEQITQVEPSESVSLNLSQDYKETLRKYKEKTLNLNDLIVPNKVVENVAVPEEEKVNEIVPEVCDVPADLDKEERIKDNAGQQESLLDKPSCNAIHEMLKEAAKIPTKQIKSSERIMESNAESLVDPKKEDNVLVLKQLYLQNLSYKNVSTHVDAEKILDYVDIENSIKEGVIKNIQSDSRELTEPEKDALISIRNFHNLCVPLQLALLIEQLKVEKQNLSEMSPSQLEIIDEYGRTPKDRYRVLKTFAKDIWYQMFVKVADKQN